MVRHQILLLRLALLLGDGLTAMALFVLVSIARFGGFWTEAWAEAGAVWWVWTAGYGALWMGAGWLLALDRVRVRWTLPAELMDILRATSVVAVSVFSLLFLVHAPEVSRQFLLMLFVAQLVVSIVQRRAIRALMIVGSNRGIGIRNVLVLGTGPEAKTIAARLEHHPALGYRVIGFLGTPTPAIPKVLGPLDAVETVVHEGVVDEVVAAFGAEEVSYLEPVASLCREEGKRLRVVLRPGLGPLHEGRTERLDDQEILTITNGPDRLLGLLAKRALDVALSSMALLAAAPVLLLVAMAIWLDDRGPVLFRQTRIGLHGRSFTMVKFRTMVPDAEQQLADLAAHNEISGHAFKVADDPRITRVGRFLRRASLDELPQFWNVLRGQMSLVGPRPPLPDEVACYDLWHRRRLSMKPGITGLWQVSARLEEQFDRWVELDLDYIDRWSLWLDLKILFRTLPAMLSGR